ncbi:MULTISPECIES: SDR family oxidoreductase [Streptomyces]|uniref:SDR family oxidoreductase n=1 Tax=Streptomyces doudnae TaxID=3075536 RepID=A0ABD5F0U8_9ACTN|nr:MULTISPECIES: SDR family oxidoreductase [unclassified Streptomyces]MDT0440518.1 SDR family oxidoreductase [Streptomyces sp. DSM 41981]MYQ64867.1 SDR family oxidoreductase [Streptomyces sp. SID4950]SCD87849.1 3alpha(or 20beta)-hydroxysteroid dehydrogenase [Streptomyces sp. SolWspMP-5a-2]
MGRLTGKVALVTGGSRGIGRGIVEEFAREGAVVVSADLDEVAPPVPGVEEIRLDVTDEDGWAAAVEGVERRHGRLDVLVNNAGLISYEPIETLTLAEWNRVVGVDQTGVFLGMRAAIPALRRAGGGSIINLSSAWGVVGGVGTHAYHASKGAVRSMTRNAAVTYAPDNIRANAVVPGWIATPLTDAQPADLNAAVLAGTPMRRGGTPAEIAYGCVYLASDESSYVTGTDLVIDGGLLAQ